ncbi:cation transport ATPase [Bacillus thermophilus]|uniref:Cation transport ATPase n=1 Tax=Siminovitchia thermophila TaxID=1245522 RepID=A0ABS2R756_9BACI|nr:hypothetical protein [Siminovitchia thermophila]MBM7715472.1 cation transport ATPase [Siminovitchia thermophila]ONK21433.1 hypothetical protein BLX87_21435 [Bacillus sp. VT-16-64]
MNELKEYVDFPFSTYKNGPSVSDLKEEMLGNLKDKAVHMQQRGWDEKEAIQAAKNSIESVDNLIDGNVSVHLNRFCFQAFQWAFLYLTIAWIATIPMVMIHMGSVAHAFLFLICLAMGAVYMFFAKKQHQPKVGQINVKAMRKVEKIIWMLWGLYVCVISGYMAAVEFGSNIWFLRAAAIDGPYQFGLLISQFVLPLFSIIVPLTFRTWVKLVFSSKVRVEDE